MHLHYMLNHPRILYNSDRADHIYLLDWSTIDDDGLLIIEHLTEPFKDCISYLRCDYPDLERTITGLLTYFIHHLTARTDYVLETTNASPGSNLAYRASPRTIFHVCQIAQ